MGYVYLAILFAIVVFLVFVGPPLLGLALVVSSFVAFVIGLVEYVTASLAGFTPGGSIRHLRIEPPAESQRDPAYRSYYMGPVLLDYQRVLVQTFRQVWLQIAQKSENELQRSLLDRVWSWRKNTALPKLMSVPLAVTVTAGLLLGGVAALGFVAATSLVFLLLLLLLVTGALLTAGGSRLLEVVVLSVRGISLQCSSCHESVPRPIYRCSGCDAAHRKLVPGLTGVLRRTCRCHTTLPTLLALGKSRLRAQCGRCEHELPVRGLTAPSVHIPVVAGPKAGKSVFMHSAVSRLMLRDDGFEFADLRAKEAFERNVELGVHHDPSRALKTAVVKPRAYPMYVGKGRAKRLLYLYDPAGEHVESVDHLADAQFLAFTKGIVFIVDPFSLRQVRSDTSRTVLGKVSASNTPPKGVLERFVEALGERGFSRRGNRIGVPMAVVLTKCDGLLDASGPPHPYAELASVSRADRSLAVRSWLAAMGQQDLLSSLDNRFTTVSYFAVSYADAVEVTTANDDPAAPLSWLLNGKED